MTNQVVYRKVKEQDAELIWTIDKSHYGEDVLSIFFIKDCCKMFRDSFMVATHNDEVVAFCIGLTSRSEEDGFISALTVSKEFEGKGIGKRLLEEVLSQFSYYGCDAVSLTAEPSLVQYYQKLGFHKNGDEGKDYHGKNVFIMEKTLAVLVH